NHVSRLGAPGRAVRAEADEAVVPRSVDRARGRQVGRLVGGPPGLPGADAVVLPADLPEGVRFAGIRGPDLGGALHAEIVAGQLVDLGVVEVSRGVPAGPARRDKVGGAVGVLIERAVA